MCGLILGIYTIYILIHLKSFNDGIAKYINSDDIYNGIHDEY